MRDRTARALLQTDQRVAEAIETLIALLQDPNENVRWSAVRALGQQCAHRNTRLSRAQAEHIVFAMSALLNDPTTDGTPILSSYGRLHDDVWEALWQARVRVENEP